MSTKSRMRNKFLCALLLISIVFVPLSVQTVTAAPTTKITSRTISDTGLCEVIGYITNYKPGTMVTFLMIEGTDISNLSADKIIYVYQCTTGNNGAFMFRFNVNWLYGSKTAQMRIGNSAGAPVYSTNVTLPPLPPDIGVVDNNSVMYGKDIYYIPGSAYTGDNIAESLTDSGTTGTDILYKIGDCWFNLSDDNAVDNSFLNAENALEITTVEARLPRYYYSLAERIVLKYFIK